MSTTTTRIGINELRGPSGPQGELRCFEVAVQVSGTYATASKPSFDFLAALQDSHFGATAVSVKSVLAWRDRYDGTTRYTASNGGITLSGTGNKVATFTIESGATNGDTGSEVSDSTVVTGVYVFLVVASITAE